MQPLYGGGGAIGSTSNYHQMGGGIGVAHTGGSSSNYHQMSSLGSLQQQQQSMSLQAGQAMFTGQWRHRGVCFIAVIESLFVIIQKDILLK